MEKKYTGLGIASLVLGIIAIVLSCIPYVNAISLLLGLISIIFAIITFASKQAKKVLAIVGLVLSILAILVAILIDVVFTAIIIDEVNNDKSTKAYISSNINKSTDELLKKDVSVKFGKFKAEKNKYGYTSKELPIIIKNKSKEKRTYNISIAAYDSNGNQIRTGFVTAVGVKPGETVEKKAFTYIADTFISDFENATYKVTNISAFKYDN